MTTLPIAEARAKLSKLVEEASATHERFEITRNGERVAILLGADDYDALRETIAVLSDSDLLHQHLRGLDEVNGGEGIDKEGVAAIMRESGRLGADD